MKDILSSSVLWNLDYPNPRFFKTPDSSNQELFPLDLLRSNLSPNFRTSDFSNQIRFPLEVRKIGIPL